MTVRALPPPRRPSRWSPTCAAVVVQTLGAFVLAALVAWPARVVVVGEWLSGDGRVVRLDEDPRLYDLDDARDGAAFLRRHADRLEGCALERTTWIPQGFARRRMPKPSRGVVIRSLRITTRVVVAADASFSRLLGRGRERGAPARPALSLSGRAGRLR